MHSGHAELGSWALSPPRTTHTHGTHAHTQKQAAAPGSLPPLPALPSASPLAPLVSAIEEPARLADAYAAARNTAAAQQWADATAKEGKKDSSLAVALPPSVAATKPLVVATAQAGTGAPNPTAKTQTRTGAPTDPVEAVVEAGADAVSGRPPRVLELIQAAGPPRGEVGGPAARAKAKGAHRRLLAGTAVTAEGEGSTAEGKPRMSQYKLFKTADPHRVSFFFLVGWRARVGAAPGPPTDHALTLTLTHTHDNTPTFATRAPRLVWRPFCRRT